MTLCPIIVLPITIVIGNCLLLVTQNQVLNWFSGRNMAIASLFSSCSQRMLVWWKEEYKQEIRDTREMNRKRNILQLKVFLIFFFRCFSDYCLANSWRATISILYINSLTCPELFRLIHLCWLPWNMLYKVALVKRGYIPSAQCFRTSAYVTLSMGHTCIVYNSSVYIIGMHLAYLSPDQQWHRSLNFGVSYIVT